MLTEPMVGDTAWRVDDLITGDGEPDWLYTFDQEELEELDRLVGAIGGRDVHALCIDDFPMPRLEARIRELIDVIDTGRGFAVVRGLPLGDGFDHEGAAAAFWAVCSRVGRLVPTTRDGQFLNHVYDRGPLRDPNDRVYTTNTGGYLHTDGVEVVGLMCLQPAPVGGESIIASSMTVYNTVLEEHPEWLPILYRQLACDWKNEAPPGSRGWYPQSLYCYVDGWLSATLKTGFHRSAQRFADVRALTDDELECMDFLESVPQRTGLTMETALEPGDIQLVNNYVTLHSRQPYEDDPGDPASKRHMLRYWMSRSGLSPRKVSSDYEFSRQDYFGLRQSVPELRKI